ncbi:uncharacterized protein LOC135497935 [Lineus longissimus]|uniref:uncharacterized protein LOC135497935 n=1 Tax=Lineus longissimus TaxID=88925 RepID=UPI002B4C952D
MPERKILDLEELILDYARGIYEDREQTHLEKTFKTKLPWDKVDIRVDRSKLSVQHEDPLHVPDDSVGRHEPRNTVLFKSKYNNTTENDMSYSVSTTRHTRTTVSCTITKGFCFGVEFEFKIGTPVLESTVTASSELSFEKSEETTREQEISWTIDTVINVPAKMQTNVELVVKEDEYKGTFRARTYFRGKVYVNIRKDNTDLCRVIISDLRKIFTKRRGFESDETDQKVVYYETRGICNCKFGVEQEVVISEQPISPKLLNGNSQDTTDRY